MLFSRLNLKGRRTMTTINLSEEEFQEYLDQHDKSELPLMSEARLDRDTAIGAIKALTKHYNVACDHVLTMQSPREAVHFLAVLHWLNDPKSIKTSEVEDVAQSFFDVVVKDESLVRELVAIARDVKNMRGDINRLTGFIESATGLTQKLKYVARDKHQAFERHFQNVWSLYPVSSHLDSRWVFFERVLDSKHAKAIDDKVLNLTRLWVQLKNSCGFFYVFEGFTIITPRPKSVWALGANGTRQLHSASGPALEYEDGFKLYYWNGANIPAQWIEDIDSVDPQLALTLEQQDQRMILREIMGWERIMKVLDCKVIDEDADEFVGKLVEATLPETGRNVFLMAKCGTGRPAVIRVNPECKTALEAQSRAYNVPPEVIRRMAFRT